MCRNCFTFEINTAVSFFNNVGFLISDYRSTESATNYTGKVNKNTLIISAKSRVFLYPFTQLLSS
jgi:hypothetical protein